MDHGSLSPDFRWLDRPDVFHDRVRAVAAADALRSVAAGPHACADLAMVHRHAGAVAAMAPGGSARDAPAHGLLRLHAPRHPSPGVDRHRVDAGWARAGDLGIDLRVRPRVSTSTLACRAGPVHLQPRSASDAYTGAPERLRAVGGH